jgi:ATP-dependent Lon protease
VADTETLSAKEPETGARTEREIPADAIAIVPVRQLVMFPGMVIPVTLGRPRSVAAAQDAVRGERQIGVLAQRDASVDEPGEIDL